MIKVGIIGANGYLGVELIRILSVHPEVKLSKIFQREMEIDEEFPHLKPLNLKDLQTSNLDEFKNLDCVFLSLPHGSAREYVKELLLKAKIIDLSSDFRISNQEDYNKYYKTNFDADIQSKFQYGFIENSIDYLMGDAELVALRSREVLDRPLIELDDASRSWWKWFNIIVSPLLIILLGFFRLRSQKKRSEELQSQYG